MKNPLATMVMVFIIAIVGIVLIGSLADEIVSLSTTMTRTNYTLSHTTLILPDGSEDINESINLTLPNYDWYSITVVTNDTGEPVWAADTDYVVNVSTQEVWLLNSSNVLEATRSSNASLWTYEYYPSSYLKSSVSRVLLSLITIFFAVGIVLFVYSRINKEFIDNLLKR